MCGIGGLISFNQKTIDAGRLAKISVSQQHRGPDYENSLVYRNIGFCHQRLKIIDLSDEANQPMQSNNGRYAITYNGELYNYLALKNKYNLQCKTASDTEVILELINLIGLNKALSVMDGMFAFGLLDKQENKVHLVRDRVGIKPLFYHKSKEEIIFSSELAALKNSLNKAVEINRSSVYKYLHLGYIPSPFTVFEDVHKLEQSHILTIDLYTGDISKLKYFDSFENLKLSEIQSPISDFKKVISQSVKDQLIADVPVGVFLSGGTDSSLIAALAQEHFKSKVKTFSIGFKESKFDESHYAEKVAKQLKTEHYNHLFLQDDAKQLLTDVGDGFGEPFADSSYIPTYLLSKYVKQHVTVALSGDGGDELFLGYGSYHWRRRLENIPSFLYPILNKVLKRGGSRYKRISHLFTKVSKGKISSHIFSQEQYYFSQDEINQEFQIFKEELVKEFPAATKQAIFDYSFYLPDDLLVKVDRMSMRNSLEVRVPFLSNAVIDFAFQLPEKYKIGHGENKMILKRILESYLDKELIYRPKWGFGVPIEDWLKNDLKYLIDDFLNKEVVETFDFVTYTYVESLLQRYFNGESYLYNRLWQLIVLHKWLKLHTGNY